MYRRDLIICDRCQSINKRLPLAAKEEARCAECGAMLYSSDVGLEYKILSWSLTALVLFVLANIYPLISIDIAGMSGSLTILEAISRLYDEGFLFVSFFALLVLVVFPFLLMSFLFAFSLFAVAGIEKEAAKTLLLGVSVIRRWSMLDIFFISVLVAMIKIYEYARIEFGVAFWALASFIVLEILLVRMVPVGQLWDVWERRYHAA